MTAAPRSAAADAKPIPAVSAASATNQTAPRDELVTAVDIFVT